MNLLYLQQCFIGRYTTCKLHTKLHPTPERCIFHILTSDDINAVFPAFSQLFVQTVSRKWQAIDGLYNKKKITWWLEDMNFVFSC